MRRTRRSWLPRLRFLRRAARPVLARGLGGPADVVPAGGPRAGRAGDLRRRRAVPLDLRRLGDDPARVLPLRRRARHRTGRVRAVRRDGGAPVELGPRGAPVHDERERAPAARRPRRPARTPPAPARGGAGLAARAAVPHRRRGDRVRPARPDPRPRPGGRLRVDGRLPHVRRAGRAARAVLAPGRPDLNAGRVPAGLRAPAARRPTASREPRGPAAGRASRGSCAGPTR